MPAPASVRIGPEEMALTRIFLRAEVDREIAHRSFERRLGETHGVVVRHRALAAIVGQREHGAAVGHQRGRAFGGFGEGEAGDQHGAQKILARRVGIAAGELCLVGEGDGVDEKVERAPRPPNLREHRVDRRDVLDVAGHDEIGADRGGERLYPLGQARRPDR